jgi:hypothetical protein
MFGNENKVILECDGKVPYIKRSGLKSQKLKITFHHQPCAPNAIVSTGME